MRGQITEKEVRKRRMLLLDKLVSLANGRVDTLIPIQEITTEVKIVYVRGWNNSEAGFRFFDVEKIEGRTSDMCYDLCRLFDEELITAEYLPYTEQDRERGADRGHGIAVTDYGFAVHHEFRKSYLVKLFENHPITFLQWAIALIGGVIGWTMGYLQCTWKH